MKNRLTVDEITDTPTSRRRLGRVCSWDACRLPAFGRTHLCSRHNEMAHQEYVKQRKAHTPDGVIATGMCVMPGCDKMFSDMPWLHLCNAHLAIINQEVEKRGSLLSVAGHISGARQADLEAQWRREAQRSRTEREKASVVYYVQVGAHIKIGWTTDLQSRMRDYPPNSILLAVHPGTRADEANLHKRFAHHRTHGREWYAPVPSVLHHIDAMKREHGEPETVTFGAQPVTIPEPRPTQYVAMRSRSGASYPRASA